jgi:hypothetical protein
VACGWRDVVVWSLLVAQTSAETNYRKPLISEKPLQIRWNNQISQIELAIPLRFSYFMSEKLQLFFGQNA